MLIVISGLSGAGKSTALHALEDLGFFCTDNLPASMLGMWAENVQREHEHAAVCMDIRSYTENSTSLIDALNQARQKDDWAMLFIDADADVLQRRFSTLRRKHPFTLLDSSSNDLNNVLLAERQALSRWYDMADLVLNSSDLTPYELANLVEVFWRSRSQVTLPDNHLTCSLISFSYQLGIPSQADMVIDLRFLPNPHYQDDLATKTGQDQAVQAFFLKHPEVEDAKLKLQDWLSFTWPKLKHERKRYFTLAIGCSGGRHRSVYMVETLAQWMQAKKLAIPIVKHRELT
ncbi:MAG: RNase adapter RapZ [Mariprofundaceae bacterium]